MFKSTLGWGQFLWVSVEASICEDKKVFGPSRIRLSKKLTHLLHRIIQFSKILMVLLKPVSVLRRTMAPSVAAVTKALLFGVMNSANC